MVSVTVIREGREIFRYEGMNFNPLEIIRLQLERHVTFGDQVLVHNGKLVPHELNCPAEDVGIWTVYDHATIHLYRRIPEQIINVQVVFGGRIYLQGEISSTETVLVLKKRFYEDKIHLPPHRQMLESHGLPMIDDRFLDAYIIEGDIPPTFYLYFTHPHLPITVLLVIPGKEDPTEMEVDSDDEIYMLYLMVTEKGLIDEDDEAKQQYYLTDDYDNMLEPFLTFDELGVRNEDRIWLNFDEEDD